MLPFLHLILVLTPILTTLYFCLEGVSGISKIGRFFLTQTIKSLFYSWNRRTWKRHFLQDRKKVYFKPSAIFRKAKLDSASKSPRFMVTRAAFTWEDGGGRHATCMHSKLKQKVSDNGQLAQAKKGLGTSRSSDRKGKDIMKFCSEAGRKQFIIVVPEKIPSLCSCWECPLKT